MTVVVNIKVHKIWGYEQNLISSELYTGKMLHIYQGKYGSYHYHKLKDETFCLISGKVLIRYSNDNDYDNSEKFILTVGNCFRIKPGLRHQIYGIEESEILEVSTADYESDSYRVITSDKFNT